MRMVRVATRRDAAAIEQVRLAGYGHSRQFRLADPRTVSWGAADEDGLVLAVWDGAEARATMRLNLMQTADQVERAVECELPSLGDSFPAVVVGGTATRPEARDLGLNTLLRYHMIDAAMGAGACSVIAIIFDGAPRLRLMRELGYEFAAPLRTWFVDLDPQTRTLVAALPREHFLAARMKTGEMASALLAEYPWSGERPRLGDHALQSLLT